MSQKPEGIELSIVIVSYNVRDRLRDCLESLRAASETFGRPIEIVVVDNASADGTVEALAPAFPEAVFVAMDRNLGFGMACNRGAALTTGRRILYLNPDTIVFPETLGEIVAFADSHPDAGIVGCRILDTDGRLQLACRRSIPTPSIALWRFLGLSFLFPRSRVFGRYNLTYLDPAQSSEVEAVSGSFMLIDRELHDTLGGFDEDFFLYGEDLDLCHRVRKAGRTVWYCGTASIVHHKGKSAASRPWGARLDFYQAMVIFARKHLGFGHIPSFLLRFAIGLVVVAEGGAGRMRAWRRWGGDLLAANLLLFAVASVWMSAVRSDFYLGAERTGHIWHLALSAWILATLGSAGEYRGGKPLDHTRFILSVMAACTGFFGTALLFKEYVFSRVAILLTAVGVALLLSGMRMLAARRRSGAVRRSLVIGTGDEARALGQQLARLDTMQVLGFLSVDDEGEAPNDERARPLVVGRLDAMGPIVRALEADTLVVPDSADSGAILRRLRECVRGPIDVLLALPDRGTALPLLVDITLDRSIIPEHQR